MEYYELYKKNGVKPCSQKFRKRKELVDGFGLLQNSGVDLGEIHPLDEMLEAHLNAVDVPSCGFHGTKSSQERIEKNETRINGR